MLFVVIKNQVLLKTKASRLLIKLGIRTLLSNIPLIGDIKVVVSIKLEIISLR